MASAFASSDWPTGVKALQMRRFRGNVGSNAECQPFGEVRNIGEAVGNRGEILRVRISL
jgi:hypothetical protein